MAANILFLLYFIIFLNILLLFTEFLNISDATNDLLVGIESFFLHGLKDSFILQTINVLAGADIDRRPKPNFWSLLLVISHKQLIKQLTTQMTQLTSDIGLCRGWIRQALNDTLLSSYLNTIRRNNSCLTPYYHRYALIRDDEMIDVIERLLEGIETCHTFELPCNSSLLNIWPDNSLQLSGHWIPPKRLLQITTGVDIASSILNEDDLGVDIEEKCVEGVEQHISIDDDISLEQDIDILFNRFMEENLSTLPIPSQQPETFVNLNVNNQPIIIESTSTGNSVSAKQAWSSSLTIDNAFNDTASNERSSTITRSISMTSSLRSPIDKHSYNTLIERHGNINPIKLNVNELWECFESSLGMCDENGIIGKTTSMINKAIVTTKDGRSGGDNTEDINLPNDFEFIEVTSNNEFSLTDLHKMVEQTCRLPREFGLDTQGYICCTCANPLGIGFSKAQVCSFSGYYYCDSCMSLEVFLIPSRVIYNWDFKRYPVSLVAATFLTDFQYQPFIDLKLLNPIIYTAINEMSIIEQLRIQLNFIRAYLFTCRESTIDKIQQLITTKEYIHESVHRYSISDFYLIQKGTLIELLQKTVKFGQQHIIDCPLCSQKGFICEVCNSPKVLYPFDIKTTFRCYKCGAVYHSDCLSTINDCRKCERKKKREDLPLLNVNNT